MGAIFKAEKRSKLMEKAADQLRSAIKSGKIKAGNRLIETDIANEMQIGRNAIREAIRYLEKEGLVSTTPYNGAHVTEFTTDDLYALRLVLEELAIKKLVEHLDSEKIAKLENVVIAMKQAAAEGVVEKIIDADLNFHRMICELSGNRMLLDAWLNLAHKLRVFISDQLIEDNNPGITISIHFPVLDAIKNGDSNLAIKRIKKIITEGYRIISKHYKQKPDAH